MDQLGPAGFSGSAQLPAAGTTLTLETLSRVGLAWPCSEHITAVFVAAKDKMDLAIGVALGSSIQVNPKPYCSPCFRPLLLLH